MQYTERIFSSVKIVNLSEKKNDIFKLTGLAHLKKS